MLNCVFVSSSCCDVWLACTAERGQVRAWVHYGKRLRGAACDVDWLFIDRVLVDGVSRVPVYVVARRLIQPLQNGLVQFYALSMALALAVLLAALLLNPMH